MNDSPNWALKTSAGAYTGTLWVRSDTPGATLNLRFREYNGSTLVATTTTPIKLTTAWQQVSIRHQVAVPGSTLDLNAYVSNAAAGSSFYTDDATVYLGS